MSPLTADLGGLPQMLIQSATGDKQREDAHQARRHGVDARLERYPVDTHVFQLFWSFLPEATDALKGAADFIRETTLAADARAS